MTVHMCRCTHNTCTCMALYIRYAHFNLLPHHAHEHETLGRGNHAVLSICVHDFGRDRQCQDTLPRCHETFYISTCPAYVHAYPGTCNTQCITYCHVHMHATFEHD